VLNFILRKLFYGILVLWGVVSFVFLIFSIKPGDPARMMGGQHATAEVIASINKDLGLDLPLYKQYLFYINDILPLSILEEQNKNSRIYNDPAKYSVLLQVPIGKSKSIVLKKPYLRRSYQSRKKVSEIIWEAFPGTFILAIVAMTFALIVGLFAGVFSALFKGSFFDNSTIFLSVLGMSGPSFFMAILISWLGGYVWYETTSLPVLPFVFFIYGSILYTYNRLKDKKKVWPLSLISSGFKFLFIGLIIWAIAGLVQFLFPSVNLLFITKTFDLPGTGLEMTGSLYEYDVFTGRYLSLQNLILPAITLGIRPLAVIVQLTRSSMIEVMDQDYIRTAKAKGLSMSEIVWKHAIKNTLNPIITAVSGWFASMLAGAVFVEYVFGWKGLGLELFNSLIKDDLPVVMGSVLFIAAIFVVMNILVDIIYGILDPRIRI
jgi:ABC-type dipeptide/oligopeptide/nickel transport system permease component